MPTHGPHKYGPTNLIKEFYRSKAPIVEVICQKGRYSNVGSAATSIKNQLVKSKYRGIVYIMVRNGRLYMLRRDMKNFIFPYGGEVYVDGKIVELPRRELKRDKKANLSHGGGKARKTGSDGQRDGGPGKADGGDGPLPPESDEGRSGQSPGSDGGS